MKYVNFLFHIYQPPVQADKVLRDIVQQSYDSLTRLIRDFSNLRFTLNVNFSLVELLHQRFPEILDNIRTAYEAGTLELTATGAYHPIFPLIPGPEVDRQIKINNEGNRRLLSDRFKPEGVFPPELAVTGALLPFFKSLGYKWTIVDDSNLQHYGAPVPYNKVYSFEDFGVFCRSNFWANRFANYKGQWARGREFVNELITSLDGWMGAGDGYVIIALDGETFGHHQASLGARFLTDLFGALEDAGDLLQTAHLSELYRQFPLEPHFVPPGSWSTDAADIRNRDYFSWWKSHFNPIHQLQWRFTNLVLEKVRNLGDVKLQEDLDRALYSCQYWWASFWKFNPSEIYRGAFNMMRLVQNALDADNSSLLEAENVFRLLITEIEKKKHGAEK